ncbi:MAG: hypothetical protein G8D89_20630 [gamma proteobacterium symbiont of Clathrolucina costata]
MNNNQRPHVAINLATTLMEASIDSRDDHHHMFGICGATLLAGLVSALINVATNDLSDDEIVMITNSDRNSSGRQEFLGVLSDLLKEDDSDLQNLIEGHAHPDILRIIERYLGTNASDSIFASLMTPNAWFEIRLNVGMAIEKAAA